MSLTDALAAIHAALPEPVLAYTLHQAGSGASVHFVATNADQNLIEVDGFGCDIESAWNDACEKLRVTP